MLAWPVYLQLSGADLGCNNGRAGWGVGVVGGRNVG